MLGYLRKLTGRRHRRQLFAERTLALLQEHWPNVAAVATTLLNEPTRWQDVPSRPYTSKRMGHLFAQTPTFEEVKEIRDTVLMAVEPIAAGMTPLPTGPATLGPRSGCFHSGPPFARARVLLPDQR